MKIYTLYHDDSDGRFAGFCSWHHHLHEPNHTLIAVQYGQPFPLDLETLTKEDKVYIVDFSYDRVTLEALNEKVGFLKVLDHHKTAEEELRGLPYAHYDLTKSGALLAWEYFFPNSPAPKVCLLVNDRDLWKWEFDVETAAMEAWLRTHQVKSNWAVWEMLVTEQEFLEQALTFGTSYLQYEKSTVDGFVKNPSKSKIVYLELAGAIYKVCVYQSMGILISELGAAFNKKFDIDFTMDYRIHDGYVVCSLRTLKTSNVDVGRVARDYAGGGGHEQAAGFQLPFGEWVSLMHIVNELPNLRPES